MTPPSHEELPLTAQDFYKMSEPELLEHCGDRAERWADAFCKIKECQGWSAADIDKGLMLCWFANAIEHSSQVRGVAQAPPSEPLALQATREDERLACWKIADGERIALKNSDPTKAAWLVAFDIANAIKSRGYA